MDTPPSGTAVYLGAAEGAYVYGDNEGVWWSRVILDAKFVDNDSTISGCVGCALADPNGEDRGVYTYESLKDLKADRLDSRKTSISHWRTRRSPAKALSREH